MIVAPQDQFYIETNLANCSFTQFVQYAHLPTQNTVPSKNLILDTMTQYPLQTIGLVI